MKNKLFNGRLYQDFLKQLRLPAIIFAVLALVISLLVPVISFIQQYTSGEIFPMGMPSISSVTPILVFLMFLAPVTLVISAFSFLNKRSSSDYYHSLPNTRLCTFLSAISAVLTWLYAIVLATVLLTTLTYNILGLPMNNGYIPYLLGTFLSGMTSIAGVTALAVSITGTFFTNIVVTGLVMILPRFITSLYALAVNTIVPIASAAEFGLFITPDYNIPVAMIFGAFTGGLLPVSRGFNDLMTFGGGILYTFLLGVVLLALAALLFCRRKSEAAGRSAPNRVLQHIYRCAVTLPIVLIPAVMFAVDQNKSEFLTYNLPFLIIFFVASLLIYFIYEIITTKTFRRLWKTIPVYLAVLAFSGIFSVGVVMLSDTVLHVTPEAEQIESVSVHVPKEYGRDRTYAEILQNEVKFEDPQMKQLLADNLRETVNIIERDRNLLNQEGYYYQDYALHLKNGSTVTRTIYVPEKTMDQLGDIRANSEVYQAVLEKLPTDQEVSNIYVDGIKDVQEIWDCYRQEFEQLTPAQRSKVLQYENGSYIDEEDPVYAYSSIRISGSVGMESYTSFYQISSLMPKTAALFIERSNEGREDFQKQLAYIKELDEGRMRDEYASIDFYVVEGVTWNDPENGPVDLTDMSFSEKYYDFDDPDARSMIEVYQSIIKILEEQPLKNAVPGESCIRITATTMERKNTYDTNSMYLSLTQAQIDSIVEVAGDMIIDNMTGAPLVQERTVH